MDWVTLYYRISLILETHKRSFNCHLGVGADSVLQRSCLNWFLPPPGSLGSLVLSNAQYLRPELGALTEMQGEALACSTFQLY